MAVGHGLQGRKYAVEVPASGLTAMVEPLESRRLFAASLQVENLDVLPGFERMIFNRIRNTNVDLGNYVKERGTLKLTNTGDQTLRFSDVKITGPFRILGLPPSSIAPGKFIHLSVQFTATATPAFTYNQTMATTNQTQAGAWIGSMTFKTNDPNNLTYTEGLAGWFQEDSERNEEPNLQTIVNLIGDFKTNINSTKIPTLSQPDDAPKYYGEEVVSAYWSAADPSKVVRVRHLSSFKTVGIDIVVKYFNKTDKILKTVLTTDGLAGQSFLPYKKGLPNEPATATFGPGSNVFGFRIDNSYSDDKLNTVQKHGGHQVRFFPLRDHFGNVLANTYFMTMDYAIDGFQNGDFQDNVYILTNVKPAGN
ncbi:hypothetical protein [Humisphaera borealis]|uniref:Uncharacterized protein n=1 Tax=Humisphaera borealis TaxID=2807512 RepID=A0A7M2X145_9BACT|nr:hypothetical protein [Humisphaera borealis]QOV91456.1 hypothetical protein IPV69_08905 [Humisphaera borealis]